MLRCHTQGVLWVEDYLAELGRGGAKCVRGVAAHEGFTLSCVLINVSLVALRDAFGVMNPRKFLAVRPTLHGDV